MSLSLCIRRRKQLLQLHKSLCILQLTCLAFPPIYGCLFNPPVADVRQQHVRLSSNSSENQLSSRLQWTNHLVCKYHAMLCAVAGSCLEWRSVVAYWLQHADVGVWFILFWHYRLILNGLPPSFAFTYCRLVVGGWWNCQGVSTMWCCVRLVCGMGVGGCTPVAMC